MIEIVGFETHQSAAYYANNHMILGSDDKKKMLINKKHIVSGVDIGGLAKGWICISLVDSTKWVTECDLNDFMSKLVD